MDPKGKIVVITGATSGLGQALAVDLAVKSRAMVYVVGRDVSRGKETIAQIKGRSGDAELIVGDVSTKAGVESLAAAILAKTKKIDVLVNNAGGSFKTETKTAEGIETTFAVNTMGAFLLERALHGALVAAKGRVVNVATGFLNSFPVDPDDLVAPKKFSSLKQYGGCKHASVMMTVELAKKYAADGVGVVSIHPGVIMGTRFGGGQPKVAQMIGGPIMRAIGFACTLEEATRRFRVACFDEVPSGSYVVKGKVDALPKQSNDEAVRGKVMALLETFTAPPPAAQA